MTSDLVSFPRSRDSRSVPARSVGRIRILVVDDHPVVRHGIVSMLGTQDDFEVVGEAASCMQGCEAVERLRPDVVILDLEMGDASGLESIERLRANRPDLPLVVYTATDHDSALGDLLQARVQGFIKKRSNIDALFEAVRVVATGGSFLDPAAALKMMQRLGMGQPGGRGTVELTDRERTVLRLIAQGKRNKEISRELFISEYTVKFHVSSMLGKLDASNRTEAVRIAAARGLIKL